MERTWTSTRMRNGAAKRKDPNTNPRTTKQNRREGIQVVAIHPS